MVQKPIHEYFIGKLKGLVAIIIIERHLQEMAGTLIKMLSLRSIET